jgi:hypothetical protein
MQLNYNSAALAGRSITLPAPKRTRPRRTGAKIALPTSRREPGALIIRAAGNDAWEAFAWLAIAVCSLGVLILSLV